MVTEFARPAGLPNANTSSPLRRRSESPKRSAGSPAVSTFSTARSVSLSRPTTRALSTGPGTARADADSPPAVATVSATRTCSAPATTCALVRMYPPESTTTPEPRICSRSSMPVRPGASTEPSAVTATCTTDGDTRRTNDSMASLSARSGGVATSRFGRPCVATATGRRHSQAAHHALRFVRVGFRSGNCVSILAGLPLVGASCERMPRRTRVRFERGPGRPPPSAPRVIGSAGGRCAGIPADSSAPAGIQPPAPTPTSLTAGS